MVKMYPAEAVTNLISMPQPHAAMSMPHRYQNCFMHPQGVT